jgi:hypothetical protein
MNAKSFLQSVLAIALAATVAHASAQPVPREPVRPVSPAVERLPPDSRVNSADLVAEAFTLTMPAATVVDRGRNSFSTPISLTVSNTGTGNAAAFAILFTVSRLDNTILWSGSAQELSGTRRDGAGNTCTSEGLAAGSSVTMVGTLSATVSRSRAILPGMTVIIRAIVNPAVGKEFQPECGRIGEVSTRNNNRAQRLGIPLS